MSRRYLSTCWAAHSGYAQGCDHGSPSSSAPTNLEPPPLGSNVASNSYLERRSKPVRRPAGLGSTWPCACQGIGSARDTAGTGDAVTVASRRSPAPAAAGSTGSGGALWRGRGDQP